MAASATKRQRRRSSELDLTARVTGILLMVTAFLYLYSLWRTQSVLNTLEEESRFRIPAFLFRKHTATQAASQGEHTISMQTDPQSIATTQANQSLPIQKTVPNQQPSPQIPALLRKHAATEAVSQGDLISIQADAQRVQKTVPNQQPTPQAHSTGDKFIFFIPISSGQGTGNIIAGLLAAHLLAIEFNRTVCVSPLYKTFLDAFEPANPVAIEKCPKLSAENLPLKTDANSVRLINFSPAPDECLLKSTLASDIQDIYLEGNTYPRWPAVPDNFFFTNYRAKPQLLKALPYKESPTTVVHLRQSDGQQDFRKGLDDDSLKGLGEMLPRDTYLVTNRVEWYDKFEKEYGWFHPEWDQVVHSAFAKSWGVRGSKQHESAIVDREKQNLQMWCDWYTILTAKFVYHTHSDYSISAIHWQNLDSRTIKGWNATSGKLELEEESWRVTGETERLVNRTVGGKGTSDLRLCKS